MNRLCETFRWFVYLSVGILFAFFVIVTALNFFIPIGLICEHKNLMWLLLYIAEPILLFVDIYLWKLLEDLKWWV